MHHYVPLRMYNAEKYNPQKTSRPKDNNYLQAQLACYRVIYVIMWFSVCRLISTRY